VGGKRRRAEGADLALSLQIGERAQRLFNIGVRVGAVNLVQVDPVGVQPAQAVLDLADDPAPRVSALVRVASGAYRRIHRNAHLDVDLRREHHVVAPAAGEGLADDDLQFAL
jgi:hypothetical protein